MEWRLPTCLPRSRPGGTLRDGASKCPLPRRRRESILRSEEAAQGVDPAVGSRVYAEDVAGTLEFSGIAELRLHAAKPMESRHDSQA